jgi:hypothetical protein
VKRKLGLVTTVGALAVALTLVLAACGGGGGDSNGVASLTDTTDQSSTDGSSGSTGKGKKDPEEAALEYTKCMREHGVDMDDPGAGGELRLEVRPGNRKKVEAAQKACEGLLENARPKLSEEQQAALQEALLACARCMREHGIDMPDPTFGEGGKMTQQFRKGDVNPDDPKFKEAEKACEPIMEEARRKADLPEPQGGRGFRRSSGGS